MKLALLRSDLTLEQARQLVGTIGLDATSVRAVPAASSGLYTVSISAQATDASSANPDAAGTWGLVTPDQRERFATAFKQARCDFAVLGDDFHPSQFRLLAMDMDSTLINIECIDEIADFVGKKAEVSAITEAAMRGEIKDFSESLTRRVALLAGVDASNLEAVFRERLRLNPGAEQLLAFAKQHGWKTLLVSGGFTFFTERLKAQLGLDHARSNTLEIIDGKLTGRVLGDIVDAQRKADTVAEVSASIGANSSQAVVMGDGANDLKMMAIAGASVAYRAKPVVQQQARFAINFNGLDTLNAWFEAARQNV